MNISINPDLLQTPRRPVLRAGVAIALLVLFISSSFAQGTSLALIDVPTSAAAVKPVKVGEKAPNAEVKDAQGKSVKLADVYSSAPTVMIFYRGGWCPYCNTQLGKLALIEKELMAAGFQVLALSSDAPEFLEGTAAKASAGYTLLSDSEANASRAFGLAFRVDDGTVKRYLGYKIDLEKRAGSKQHHILPVPAVYIVDQSGIIRYAYWNADYKQRADEKEILGEARKLAQ